MVRGPLLFSLSQSLFGESAREAASQHVETQGFSRATNSSGTYTVLNFGTLCNSKQTEKEITHIWKLGGREVAAICC